MTNRTNHLTEGDIARLITFNRRLLRTTNERLFQLKGIANKLYDQVDKTKPETEANFQLMNVVRDTIREGKQFRANQERIQKALKKMIKG
jgi:hypothetical protein